MSIPSTTSACASIPRASSGARRTPRANGTTPIAKGVEALRLAGPPPLLGDKQDARFVESTRAYIAQGAARDVSPLAIDVQMIARGELRYVRASYATTKSTPPLGVVELVVPSAHGTYELRFLAPQDRAGELAPIVDRAAATLHARPAPRAPRAGGVAALLVVGSLSLAGTVALLVMLRDGKKRRASTVAWPGLRG